MHPMRILLTNDDGIDAPGLQALYSAVADLGEVTVVAPDRQRSAVGHAVTLHKPLRLRECRMADGAVAWSSSGTPSDCIALGYDVLMADRADLVISGINDGANLGWDVTYSGTVMAAMEAVMLGVPAIAMSVAARGAPNGYEAAARFARRLALSAFEHGMPQGVLLNVNVPGCPQGDIQGVCVTTQGRREYIDRVDTRTDPRGHAYYWLAGVVKDEHPATGSDVAAVAANFVSVTPLQLDLTAYSACEPVSQWQLRVE